MGRVARGLRHWIAGVVAGLVAGEIPLVGHRDPGLQPPDASVYLDHTHAEDPVRLVAESVIVEVAPPPAGPFTPSQFPDPAIRAKIYRRNSQFYNTQPNNTAVIWYAAEQAKKATAA